MSPSPGRLAAGRVLGRSKPPELMPPRLGRDGRVLIPVPRPGLGRLNELPPGRDAIEGGETPGRVEGVAGRDEGTLGREGSVLGRDNPPIDGRLEGRLTEGLLAEGRLGDGRETLENEGRELGLETLGLDMFGRDTLGREGLGLEPPERPIEGREPEGRDFFAWLPDGRDTLA